MIVYPLSYIFYQANSSITLLRLRVDYCSIEKLWRITYQLEIQNGNNFFLNALNMTVEKALFIFVILVY